MKNVYDKTSEIYLYCVREKTVIVLDQTHSDLVKI